jgi:peptide/nickel transport system permease protein
MMGHIVKRGVMIFVVLGFSPPVCWLGFLLIYAVAMQLSILPVQGDVNLSQGLQPFLKHLILPALTLGLVRLSAWSLD